MPEAPPPTYDTYGNIVVGWTIRAEYSPIDDLIYVTEHHDAGPYYPSRHTQSTFDPLDIEDVAAALQRSVRVLGSRRLF